jgi:nitroreductase
MDYFEVIDGRQSIRAYQHKPIEPEKLQQVLQAVNRAPSAGNLQAFEVYLVCDQVCKSVLAGAAYDQGFLAEAPVVLIFCAHASRAVRQYGQRGADLYCVQDATIACTFAMLAAAALGLSTVWVGSFDEDRVRSVIGAPRTLRPVAVLPVGYPAESPPRRPRRALEDLVHQVP